MKLEIILALVLVTTLCSGHTLVRRETDTDPLAETLVDTDVDTNLETDVDTDPDVNIEAEINNEDNVESDVEDTNDEPEKVDTAVDEGQDQNEQSVDVEQPIAHAKILPLEENKRGMDVPFMSKPEVCTGWIEDFFHEYLVLSEDRDAVFSDLQRFFIFMDDDGDSKISEEEFMPKWMEASGFGGLDTMSLFKMYFSIMGDPSDDTHINSINVEGIWDDLFMTDIDDGELTKEDFSAAWEDFLLPSLPQHGCSGVNYKDGVGDILDAMKENIQIRPDVYGYYRRKRK